MTTLTEKRIFEARAALEAGDLETARKLADRAIALAQDSGNEELEAQADAIKSQCPSPKSETVGQAISRIMRQHKVSAAGAKKIYYGATRNDYRF